MKAFLIFIVQVLIVVGLVIGAVYWLELDPKYIDLIVAIGAGLIILVALIVMIPSLISWVRRIRRKNQPVEVDNEKKVHKQFARACRDRFRSVLRKVKATEQQDFFYQERLGRPWWLVVGPRGGGKTTWLREYLGATEIEEPTPGHRIRYFESPDIVGVELPVDTLGGEFERELDVFKKELNRVRPEAPLSGCVFVTSTSDVAEEMLTTVTKLFDDFHLEIPVVVVHTHLDRCTHAREVLESSPAESLVEWLSNNQDGSTFEGTRLLNELRRRVLNTLLAVGDRGRAPRDVIKFFSEFGTCKRELYDSFVPMGSWRVHAFVYASDRAGLVLNPQIFQSHLVRESNHARRSTAYYRQRLQRHGFYALVIMLVSGLFSWGAIRATSERQEFLEQTAQAVRSLTGDGDVVLSDVEPFIHALPIVETWRDGGPQRGRRMGLVHSSMIVQALSEGYVRLMCQGVLHPLVKDTELGLRKFLDGEGNDEKALELLRLYLLLTRAVNDHVPDPWTSSELPHFAAIAAGRWNLATGDKISKGRLTDVHQAIELYGTLREADSYSTGCVNEKDTELVKIVRREILRLRKTNYDLDLMIEVINADKDIKRVEVVVGSINIRGKKEVPRAFTKAGWESMQRKLNAGSPQANEPKWLIDPSANLQERIDDCKVITKRYTDRYIETWTSLVDQIEISIPGKTLEDIRTTYDEIVGKEVPLRKIFAKINEHTSTVEDLQCPERVGPEGGFDKARPVEAIDSSIASLFRPVFGTKRGRRVAEKFDPLNKFTQGQEETSRLKEYHDWITNLRGKVKEAIDSDDDDLSQLKSEITTTKSALSRVLDDEQELGEWGSSLHPILFPPINALEDLVDRTPVEGQVVKWCDTVVKPVRRLRTQYPFKNRTDTPRDASLETLKQYFHPTEGEIANFRRAYLASKLDENGKPVDSKFEVTGEVARFLKRAHDLGVLLFPSGDGISNFDVKLECSPNISPVELTVGEKEMKYSCTGKNTFSGTWPNQVDAKLVYGFRQANSRRDTGKKQESGEFALFRLMEGASLERGSGYSVIATYKLPVGPLKIVVSFDPVDDRGRTGSLLYGFKQGQDTFLSPFRELPEPPARLYSGLPGRRCD